MYISKSIPCFVPHYGTLWHNYTLVKVWHRGDTCALRRGSKYKIAEYSCFNAANFINVPTVLKLYLLVPTFSVPTFTGVTIFSKLYLCVPTLTY